jgi:Terminase small subunit
MRGIRGGERAKRDERGECIRSATLGDLNRPGTYFSGVPLPVGSMLEAKLAYIGRKTRTKITGEKIIERLVAHAFADLRSIVTVDAAGNVTVKPSDEWPDEAAESVQSIKKTQNGVEITQHSQQTALIELAKLYLPQTMTPPGSVNIQKAIIYIPTNNRDKALMGATNGPDSPPEKSQPRAIIDFPPRGSTSTNAGPASATIHQWPRHRTRHRARRMIRLS